jgi:hypothetical protein
MRELRQIIEYHERANLGRIGGVAADAQNFSRDRV